MTPEAAPRELPARGSYLDRRFDRDGASSDRLVVLDVFVDGSIEGSGGGQDRSDSAYDIGCPDTDHLSDREGLRVEANDCRLAVGRHESESDTRSERPGFDTCGQQCGLRHDT
jgi:hypothetical protein